MPNHERIATLNVPITCHYLSAPILVFFLLVANAAAQPPTYQLLNLGTLGDPAIEARGLNNLGQVVGVSYGGARGERAFRTQPNLPINPLTDDLGEAVWIAEDINDLGEVTGKRKNPIHAFRTAPNAPFNPLTDDLTSFPGQVSAGIAINELGEVVGTARDPSDIADYAFRTDPHSPITQASNLGVPFSGARGINNLGETVGEMFFENRLRAYRTGPRLRIDPILDDLGTLGGIGAAAIDINESGQVVGHSTTASGATHAFRTGPRADINPATDDLGTLGGQLSNSFAINEAGVVVGLSEIPGGGDSHAFVYFDRMYDLNTLLDNSGTGWTLVVATAINDHGQIVGAGRLNGSTRAFLLTPIPEPSATVLLVGFPLGVACFQRLRKRN